MQKAYQEHLGYGRYEGECPYNGVTICTASFSSMAIEGHKREDCCGTDDYDNCPIFLSKVLRRS